MTTRYALLFPGQGSQSVGMLAELAAAYPVVAATFAEASDVLGFDLWQLAQQGPEEQQKQTQNTQQLMLASGVACARVWSEKVEAAPVAVAGHSVGEFAALVAADCLDFSAAVKLVEHRARLMAEAVAPGLGGMAAVIGMEDAAVVDICKLAMQQMSDKRIDGVAPVVEAVNFNAPGQVVISGHLEAIEVAAALARENGARKVMPIPVSVPNHSALMKPAGLELVAHIDAVNWRKAQLPVVQNVYASVAIDVDAMLNSLYTHVYGAVQWVDSINGMVNDHGVTRFVEMGQGKVLTGMGKRINKTCPVLPVFDSPSLEQAASEMMALAC